MRDRRIRTLNIGKHFHQRLFLQHTGRQINPTLSLPLADNRLTIDSGGAMSNQQARQQPRARAQAPSIATIPNHHLFGSFRFSPIFNLLKSPLKLLSRLLKAVKANRTIRATRVKDYQGNMAIKGSHCHFPLVALLPFIALPPYCLNSRNCLECLGRFVNITPEQYTFKSEFHISDFLFMGNHG